MKYKTIIVTLSVSAVFLFADEVYSQMLNETNKRERNSLDSLKVVNLNEAQVQKARDEFGMAYTKLNRKQPKAKTKEAQRIQGDSNNTEKESKHAVRAEKLRKQSIKQAERTSKTRDKSDKNN